MKLLLACLGWAFFCLPQVQATAADSIHGLPGCEAVADLEPFQFHYFGRTIPEAIAHAATENDWPTIRVLIWDNADPAWVRSSAWYDSAVREKRNAELLKAAAGGDDERVLAAIEAGADVNVMAGVDNYMSPLIWAAACDHASTVELLITHGADVNIAGRSELSHGGILDNHTPLIAAADQANDEIVEILLKHGANPNAQSWVISDLETDKPAWRPWNTPLLASGSMRTTEILLAHGADPNITRYDGTSALMEVGGVDQYAWSKLLLAHGASPRQRNREGDTAADIARRRFDAALAELIENWAGDQKPK